jgi:hypothetical protein
MIARDTIQVTRGNILMVQTTASSEIGHPGIRGCSIADGRE